MIEISEAPAREVEPDVAWSNVCSLCPGLVGTIVVEDDRLPLKLWEPCIEFFDEDEPVFMCEDCLASIECGDAQLVRISRPSGAIEYTTDPEIIRGAVVGHGIPCAEPDVEVVVLAPVIAYYARVR
jgi:hypothetical protein